MFEKSLSRREREILDILYARGEATVAEVRDELPEPPSYSAVRALLRILVDKGHVKHRHEGPRYVYQPTESRKQARDSALQRVLRTFFENSPEKAVAALLDMSATKLSDAELQRLRALIDQARKEGR